MHMMTVYQMAAWNVVAGLSLMMVGGLVLWAYGARPRAGVALIGGPEAEATREFHAKLARWFFVYGVFVITTGAALLFWAGSYFI